MITVPAEEKIEELESDIEELENQRQELLSELEDVEFELNADWREIEKLKKQVLKKHK